MVGLLPVEWRSPCEKAKAQVELEELKYYVYTNSEQEQISGIPHADRIKQKSKLEKAQEERDLICLGFQSTTEN